MAIEAQLRLSGTYALDDRYVRAPVSTGDMVDMIGQLELFVPVVGCGQRF